MVRVWTALFLCGLLACDESSSAPSTENNNGSQSAAAGENGTAGTIAQDSGPSTIGGDQSGNTGSNVNGAGNIGIGADDNEDAQTSGDQTDSATPDPSDTTADSTPNPMSDGVTEMKGVDNPEMEPDMDSSMDPADMTMSGDPDAPQDDTPNSTGDETMEDPAAEPDPDGVSALAMSAGPEIRPSTEAEALERAGFDPLNLPRTLSEADDIAHATLMQSFTRSLGISCDGCHEQNRAAGTMEKRIAAHMWGDILGKLEFKDGSPLYCDSCHQGSMHFLDRSDPMAVMAWMSENMVAKLQLRDGGDHNCATCHGNPAVYDLLGQWAQ